MEISEQSITAQTNGLPESIRQPAKDALGTRPAFKLPNLTIVADRVQRADELDAVRNPR